MKFSWTKCPHCQKVMQFKAEGGGGTTEDFGEPKIYLCKHCKKPVSNGQKEWGELSIAKKVIAVARVIYTVIFWTAGVSLLGSGVAMIYFDLEESVVVELLIAIASLSVIVLGFLYARAFRKQILESNSRLMNRRST